MATRSPRYDAFISYSHEDEVLARRIQRFIESYSLPRGLISGGNRLRVFRDATDIRTGSLSEELNAALDDSRALIVCCSPAAAASRWVTQEIERFTRYEPPRPTVPILLKGDPAEAIPERLQTLEHRYADLRSAWFAGRLKRRGRDELIRAVATITGSDLRQLIPWEKRRRRRTALSWTTVAAVAVVAVSLIPLPNAVKLNRPSHIGDDQIIEYCDIVEGSLALAAREKINKQNAEVTNEVQYVRFYRNALDPAVKWEYLDISGYAAKNRLLHLQMFPAARKIVDGLNFANLAKKSRELARQMYSPEDYREDPFQGTWAAEPRTGLKVILFTIKLPPYKGADGPHVGRSLVIVQRNGKTVGPLIVDGLYPPELGDRRISARGASLSNGLPIIAAGDDLFIGMRIRSDGGLGGLWRWRSGDKHWELEKLPRSIYSIINDPRNPNRLLASTAPAEWESGARKGQVALQFFEREASGNWREIQIQVPQLDTSHVAQLCGFGGDGTLYLLNNQALFAVGNERLYQRWLRAKDKWSLSSLIR